MGRSEKLEMIGTTSRVNRPIDVASGTNNEDLLVKHQTNRNYVFIWVRGQNDS
jgi:hypothetical protein